ncbi:hypothetical protein MCOR28_005443 [Pyricularia oryzae]|nr:hypothetical protein MCOR26_002110 [Pyricularia oryzae]KAI6330422.1 hypothetical protein MCOR30_005168 [Pyricularia oryzae]KAI6342363.1 hypothetical protein MCOR28_005443 [Pyricularia oryzae]KAI6636134.1 hypothetical protein MCOR08_003821 [Pyricularia oryzae]
MPSREDNNTTSQPPPYTAAAAINRTVDVEVPSLAATPATVTSHVDSNAQNGKRKYPPISSVPHTTRSRLDAASPPDIPTTYIPAATFSVDSSPEADAAATADTVLYLAYGSNLCAQTFLGMRGIRPLSRTNVAAPSLRLVFDLPGMPYAEPCFANSAPRKLPKVPGGDKPPIPIPEIPPRSGRFATNGHGDPVWDKGLMGVVYEVTREDYAKIVATEGGGSSYQDILVPCLELPPSVSVPEKPSPIPELPKPFLAHTLFVPPKMPVSEDGERDPDEPKKPELPWYARFLGHRRRPDPDYAQPSLRYLNLLREGAREHDLPADYQAWLAELHHYEITTTRQKIGQWLLKLTLFPVLVMTFGLGRLCSDERGIQPLWLQVWTGMFFKMSWKLYDAVMKPLFGDGERTMVKENNAKRGQGLNMVVEKPRRRVSINQPLEADEEKRPLLKNIR